MSATDRHAPAVQLLAIAVLAVLFVACINCDRESHHPLRQAQRRLRVGMTFQEAAAAVKVGRLVGVGGTLSHVTAFFDDPKTGDWLILSFEPEHMRHRVYRIEELAHGNIRFPAPRLLTKWRFDVGRWR